MTAIPLAELRVHYELAMQQYRSLNTRQSTSGHRRACDIGWLLHEAGHGPSPRTPEDTDRSFVAAVAAGVSRVEPPDGWLESMKRK